MTDLTPVQKKERKEIIAAVEESEKKLTAAINLFNKEFTAIRAKLAQALDHYEEGLEWIRTFADTVQEEMEEAYDEKPNSFQYTEEGKAFMRWWDEWRYLSYYLEDELPSAALVDFPYTFDASPSGLIAAFKKAALTPKAKKAEAT